MCLIQLMSGIVYHVALMMLDMVISLDWFFDTSSVDVFYAILVLH